MILWYIEDIQRYGVNYESKKIIKKKLRYMGEEGILSYNGKTCSAMVCRFPLGGREIIECNPITESDDAKADYDTIFNYIEKCVYNEIDSKGLRSPIVRRASALIWSKLFQLAAFIGTMYLFINGWYIHKNFNSVIICNFLIFALIASEYGRTYIHRIKKVF